MQTIYFEQEKPFNSFPKIYSTALFRLLKYGGASKNKSKLVKNIQHHCIKYRYTILFVFLFQFTMASVQAQIIFTSVPSNMQLFGRDTLSNKGNFQIAGSVNKATKNYRAIRITVFRGAAQYSQDSINLSYSGNIANFNYTGSIMAELINYKIVVESITGSEYTIEKTIDNVVAGDVFIVQGQSNAAAWLWSGSSNANMSNFIRTFSGTNPIPYEMLLQSYWVQANGDIFSTVGAVGQWGLKIARLILDSLHVPVAVFNGSLPGAAIAFFQRPTNYQTSLESNYGRLYYRLNATNLRPHVRAVFWAQGESDGVNNTSIAAYKSDFNALRTAWLQDFPGIKRIYIFQTKNGCGGTGLYNIKEAQRQLAMENADIAIMQTDAIPSHTDACHFPFTNGYEKFATRIFPLVLKDIYGLMPEAEIGTPLIQAAYLSDSTHIVVATNAVSLSANQGFANFELSATTGAVITSTAVSGANIVFTLSHYPGTATISYLGSPNSAGPFGTYVKNTAGIELVCFYRYPVSAIPPPPPVVGVKQMKIGASPTTISQVSVLEIESTNKGFLPPRMASGASISNPPKGMLIYNTTLNAIQVNIGTPDAPNWRGMTVASECVACFGTSSNPPASPVVGQQYYATDNSCIYTYNGIDWTRICPEGKATLNCGAGVFAPALFKQNTPYTGSLTVPYTGGNGGAYSSQVVSSTGVSGLTAVTAAGSFAMGAGTIVFTVSGTPSSTGNAVFNISMGGGACNIIASVVASLGKVPD